MPSLMHRLSRSIIEWAEHPSVLRDSPGQSLMIGRSAPNRPARRSDTLLLRGHVAEVVTLAEHNSVVAQDIVGSGDVEIEVRKRETGQVLAGREAHRFRADLYLDRA